MALDLTTEEKQLGKENFAQVATDLTRRDLLKSLVMAGGVAIPAIGGGIFHLRQMEDGRVQAGAGGLARRR